MQPLKKYKKQNAKIHLALVLNISLTFVAGYADTVGFLALFGLFTAHITGNFVIFSAEIVTPGHTFPLLKMLALPAFVAGVILAKMIASSCQRKERNTFRVLCITEAALLIAFMIAGLIYGPIEENISPIAILAGSIGAIAMGLHSACGRLLLPGLTPTAMMTGNVTQCVIEFIDLFQGVKEKRTWNRFSKYFWPVVFFGLGALIAAFAYFRFGFLALLLPITIILFIASAGNFHKGEEVTVP